MSDKATETRAAKAAQDNKTETEQAEVQDNGFAANAPRDGKIVKAQKQDDNFELPKVNDNDKPIVVEDNVYQEFYPANTKRPSYRLLFHKGQTVLKSQYDAAVGDNA